MAPPRYAELRCRSCFSFLEGGSHPEELVARAAEVGLSGLALADRSGLYGMVRAHAEAKKRGFPLVVGAEVAVEDLGRGRPGWLTLLAQDREGYANLCRLLTAAHGGEVTGAPARGPVGDAPAGATAVGGDEAPLRRDKALVRLPLRALGERAGGLFALHAGADDREVARLQELFGRRLALTVARHHVAGDEARLAAARAVGARLHVPVAVVNDVHTHVRRRQVLQDVLTCVRLGTTVEKAGRRLFPNAERTLKGPEEMARLWAGFEEGLEAAAAIAEECRFRMEEIRGEHPLPPVLVERAALAPGAATATSSPLQSARAVAPSASPRLRTTVAVTGPPPAPSPRPSPPRGGGEGGSAVPPTPAPGSAPPLPPGERAGARGASISGSAPPLPSGERAGVRGAAASTPVVTGMELLRELVREGARWRYGGEPPDDVARQLEKELELVDRLGYASYFLTVWDVVRFARERGILCQGRGSAANSAVCYVLGVTSIDPVRMGLLFERFISAERGEPPDIDVDFEHERREEVLQYVYRRYGRDHAGMVCEVITYRARSALRDVGKALGLSLPQVDRLSKLVSSHDDPAAVADTTLAQAGLDPRTAPRVRQVLELARELQGFPRHLSIHVGGFVVTRRPLCETVPIEPAAMPGRTIVQWDKDDLAELDLLKVDLLALGMLTALSRGLSMLAAHRPAPARPPPGLPTPTSTSTASSLAAHPERRAAGPKSRGTPTSSSTVSTLAAHPERSGGEADAESRGTPTPGSALPLPSGERAGVRGAATSTPAGQWAYPDSLATIPAEDPAVYALASRADTIGVFQIESRAQMGLLPRLKPRCFYDLVISVAIIRPGPIQGGMVHPFLRRRDGLEEVVYPYEPLRAVLARTNGVPLFQEQAMRLAVVAAGFTPGEADELRRVMTHRRSHEKLAAMKARLVAGMAERAISGAVAEQIFKQLLGFAGYGFPESHAASFALLVYASAWLKCYHPAVFTAALLDSQPMGFYAPHTLVEDAKRHGVEVRGLDVATSDWGTTLEGPVAGVAAAPGEAPALRLGLQLVRGLPRQVGEQVLAARRERPFASVADLARRAGLSRAWVTRLAEAGALGDLAPERREAVWRSLALPAQGGGAGELFAGQAPPEPAAALEAAGAAELVQGDYATTGLSVRAHPMAVVRPALSGGQVRTVREVQRLPDRAPVEVAGLVIVRQRPETARGIVFVSLEDETGIANLVVMPDVYERCRAVLKGSPFLVARGRVERNGQVVNVRVDGLAPLAFAPAVGDRSRDFR